jgi:hypothetical protein
MKFKLDALVYLHLHYEETLMKKKKGESYQRVVRI